MQKETISKANKIISLIERNKEAVEWLENHAKNGFVFITSDSQFRFADGDWGKTDIFFEEWEIRLIIHNKKQRIAALEKELEEL